ncbi:hypothetical protein GCM10027080_01380 [Pedococcus soli]
MGGRLRVWVTTGVAVGALAALELLLVVAARDRAHQVMLPGPASVDEVTGALAASLAVALGGWLLVTSAAAVLAHAPGRLGRRADRVAARWTPLLTRRVAAVLVGATVGSAFGPATALAQVQVPSPSPSPSQTQSQSQARVEARVRSQDQSQAATPFPGFSATSPVGDPAPDVPPAGWVPSRPVQRPVVTPDLVTSGGSTPAPPEVVVQRGDTLWSLAATHLGPDATDAEVAAAWPRWHRANLSVIGDDPDLLRPGQVLTVPTTSAVATR